MIYDECPYMDSLECEEVEAEGLGDVEDEREGES